MAQFLEMERQRGRGDPECVGNGTDGCAFGPGFDQEPEHLQARALRQRGKRSQRGIGFHISMIMETLRAVKGAAAEK